MNINSFNSQTYDAAPTFSSANGISILDLGVINVSMGTPINSIFRTTNYIVKTLTNVNYIINRFEVINYIEPIVSNINYIKG
jgi:hypothetical protein